MELFIPFQVFWRQPTNLLAGVFGIAVIIEECPIVEVDPGRKE